MLTDQIIFGIAKQSINQYTEVCTTLHTTYVIAFFGIFHLQLFTFTPSLHEINLSHDVQKSRRRNNTVPKKGQKYNLISHDVRILSINTYLVPTYLPTHIFAACLVSHACKHHGKFPDNLISALNLCIIRIFFCRRCWLEKRPHAFVVWSTPFWVWHLLSEKQTFQTDGLLLDDPADGQVICCPSDFEGGYMIYYPNWRVIWEIFYWSIMTSEKCNFPLSETSS